MNRPPDIHELIGDEGTPDELARLALVHDMLVAAGPPPEGSLPEPPRVSGDVVRFRRRRWAELAVAAAFVCAAIGVGYLVGSRSDSFQPVATLSMHGISPEMPAMAKLEIGKADAEGNVPIQMRVDGLPQLPRDGWYELYLSKDGTPGASCGTFTTAGGKASVRFSVGYDLAGWREANGYDGWVVTAHVPGNPASAKRIILTT